ncbi:MAG TPA: ABC transporter permease [Chthoniobacterales bacterium]|jgi:putative ABC transport system permease protein|nr:ABC transporter permease [Chthoniobacterales bacterium]
MQNLRYALRVLGKQPLFTAIVILTFALGIGANTAVFSVVNAVLLRPLPFKDPQNLVALGEFDTRETKDPGTQIESISYLDYVDWRDQTKVFERIAVCSNQSVGTLTDGNQATHVQGESVSADLFPLLGVQPILGRTFLPKEDEPGNYVVILSYELWQRQFGGDRGIIGKNISLDAKQWQVIGVMPPRFTYPLRYSNPPELWITMSILRATDDGSRPMTEQRDNDFLQCVARLKPGVSLKQVQANIDTITANWHQQYPQKINAGAKVIPELAAMVGNTRSALLMLCAMAGCVLLVACVNVANLLLARSLSRNREISIRAALGAGRWQIIKQLLVESALLGIFGGLAGLMLAIWGVVSIKAFLPGIPRMDEISPDPRVLIFTAAISFGVGIFAGLLPAWRASHPNLATSMNEAARGSSEGVAGRRTRAGLVVIEMVLALVLLASAGLLVESFLRLEKVPAGFDHTKVITARLELPNASYPKEQDTADFYKKLLERVSVLPGVQSAAAAWWIPLSGSDIDLTFDVQERPLPEGQQAVAEVNVVTPEYFRTLRTPIALGRAFTERDDKNAPPVAIVSESFAKRYFPGENPIGKRITPNGSVEGKPPVREIVGVVADMHLISLKVAPRPQIYLPHQQFGIHSMSIFVRTAIDPQSFTTTLRRTVAEIDKNLPIYRTRTLTDYMSQSIAQPRLNAMLVGLFALIALLLAAAGIFGVMSYSVTQRTQEIGIRLALGAQRYDVLRLIVLQGMRFVGVGLVLGIIGVVVSSHLLQSFLFGIGATDLRTMVVVSLLLSAVAFIACFLPARRAARVDPIVALRAE